MDIQEKNQLFEQFKKTKTFKCFYSTLLQFDESLNCFVATEKWRNKEAELLTSAWWMFEEMQAAKAQAVPEGFVVVPKEPTDEMWSSGIDAYTDAMEDNKALPAASINDIYKAMIEAQEPAND